MVSIRLLMMMRYDAIGTKYSNSFLTLWAFLKMPGSFYLLLNILHLYLLFSLTISNLFNKISGNFIFCVDLFYGSGHVILCAGICCSDKYIYYFQVALTLLILF